MSSPDDYSLIKSASRVNLDLNESFQKSEYVRYSTKMTNLIDRIYKTDSFDINKCSDEKSIELIMAPVDGGIYRGYPYMYYHEEAKKNAYVADDAEVPDPLNLFVYDWSDYYSYQRFAANEFDWLLENIINISPSHSSKGSAETGRTFIYYYDNYYYFEWGDGVLYINYSIKEADVNDDIWTILYEWNDYDWETGAYYLNTSKARLQKVLTYGREYWRPLSVNIVDRTKKTVKTWDSINEYLMLNEASVLGHKFTMSNGVTVNIYYNNWYEFLYEDGDYHVATKRRGRYFDAGEYLNLFAEEYPEYYASANPIICDVWINKYTGKIEQWK